jgi:ADP-ribose pyrophosphatase
MSKTAAFPERLRDDPLIDAFGKLVVNRAFKEPDGSEKDFLVWGGATIPVIVFPVTADGRVVLIQQFRRAANTLVLELPGGCPKKPGDSIETTALAELREETGFVPRRIVQLGEPIWFEPASCMTLFAPVLATGCEPRGEQALDETEHLSVVTMDIAQWLAHLARGGEGRDSKSMAMTLLALPHLGIRLRDANERVVL